MTIYAITRLFEVYSHHTSHCLVTICALTQVSVSGLGGVVSAGSVSSASVHIMDSDSKYTCILHVYYMYITCILHVYYMYITTLQAKNEHMRY